MWKNYLRSIFRHEKICLLLSVSLSLFFTSHAQQNIVVKGSVTAASSQAGLSGISVQIKNSQRGTSTDTQGNYSISVNSSDILVFSNVGYKKVEEEVNGRTVINVVMQAVADSLEQVVVVAYGTQKKATITGAISSIRMKEIKQSPSANLAVTLAGRLPGLTAIQTSGEPGRDYTNLFLRGQGTVNGQNPLILVDGVERDITYIDPNEVESVSILKDASSTAMFGVRGANGVILVTTRRGKNAKPEINFSAEYGLSGFTRTPSSVNAYQYAQLRNEAGVNDNKGPNFFYSDDAINHYKTQDDPLRYPDNNWNKMLMNKYVQQNRYNLNLSGGNEYVTYFINAGYLHQGGQWKVAEKDDYDPSQFLDRYNFRTNVDAYLNRKKTLKTFLNVAGYLEKVNQPATTIPGTNPGNAAGNTFFILSDVWSMTPVQPGPLSPDDQVLTSGGQGTPAYGEINRSGYAQEKRTNVTASFGLDQNLSFITKGLSAKFMMSFDSRTVYNLLAARNYQRWEQVVDPNLKDQEGKDSVYYRRYDQNENTPLATSSASTFQMSTNFQFHLNYNRVFNEKHAVTGLIFAQQDQRILPNDRIPYNLRGISTRLTYAYDSKYFAEFNAGYNGSEQFAPGHRYGFFPSISAGWLISHEPFLRASRTISNLKVRGSYGIVGNDRLGSRRFLYLDDIAVVGGGYALNLGRGQSIDERAIGNPDTKWDVAKKVNIGFELGLFSCVNLIVDVFSEHRDNMLINRQTVPLQNGFPGLLPPVNIGKMSNHGYEIELNFNKPINRDVAVFSKLNFNYAKNKVEFIDEAQKSDDYAYRYRQTGYVYGQQFGFIADGFWSSADEIAASGLSFSGIQPRPGDLKFKDLNGDKIIDDKDIGPTRYSNVPQYTFGAALGGNWRNFDVSVLFQGVSNVSNYFTGWGVYENNNNIAMYRSRMLNAWTPDRLKSGAPIEYPALTTSTSSSEAVNNSFFQENTSYIRLKNFEIGYTLPLKLSSKIGSNKIRFYANGLNIVTWDKMRNRDFDPEVAGTLTYPITKTFNFGVNVVF